MPSARIASSMPANVGSIRKNEGEIALDRGKAGKRLVTQRRARGFVTRAERLEFQFRDVGVLPQLESFGNAPRDLPGMPDCLRERCAIGSQRNRSRVRGMKPFRAACLPRESAREVPDLVEVAFQVGEHKGAFGFGHAFFAREARRAQRQDARLDRLRSVPAIRLAEFKQANVALPVIQIPFQRRAPW